MSDLVRQLSFAGIAVIWMFRVGTDTGGIAFKPVLIVPLLTFIASLALDLLQYLYASIAWSLYARCKEKHGVKDEEIVSPHECINWPTDTFFYLKTTTCIVGYAMLILFLKDRL